MTEDEARGKHCPFGREPYDWDDKNLLAVNRDGEGGSLTFCLASACMAWRWGFDVFEQRDYKRGGYCGLAGAP